MSPVPIGVSPRHIHTSKEDFTKLFGENAFLVKRKDLSQTGQFAAEQTVTLSTPVGRIDNVRILGPFRKSTQVELSVSDAVFLGLTVPVRDSGNHEGTPGLTILGPQGNVTIAQGVIIAMRHLHMTPADARKFNLLDKQKVWMAVKTPSVNFTLSESRNLIFGDVLVRIDPSYRLDFHLDTDEANAAGVKTGDSAFIVNIPSVNDNQEANSYYPQKKLYSELDVRKAHSDGKMILIDKKTILTPSAKEYGMRWNIFQHIEKSNDK